MTSRTPVLFCLQVLLGVSIAGLGLALSMQAPSRAWAQTPPDAAATPDAYRQLIDQALSEFRHKNWPEARVLFGRAHALSPNARTLRGMGVVSYEMRDYVQAVRDLTLALTDSRQSLTDELRAEAQNLLARARTFVAVYTVSLEPTSAILKVDGSAARQEADGTLLLPFGVHTLSASAGGYETGHTQLSVQGGERGDVSLSLAQADTDGPDRPPTPVAALPARVAPAPPAGARAAVPRPSSGRLRYTWVAVGAGAMFGAAAAAFWVVGSGKLDDLDGACAASARQGMPCRKADTDTETIERYELLTNVSLGLTGAAVIAAGVLSIVEWPRTSERRVTARFGPTSVGLRGAF